MRKITLAMVFLATLVLLQANESKVCQKCHPIIYEEYYSSSHRKASVFNNQIHKAAWDKHQKDAKGYTCAKCHTPSDLDALKHGKLAKNEIQTEEPISCIYCHTIRAVEEGESENQNILNGKTREFYTAEKGKNGQVKYEAKTSWFGLVKESKNSPYHKIDYDNKNFYNGNVCMGCHSKANNEHSFDMTMLDASISKDDKNSCVTCHMPQVLGTKVTINETKTHAFHGIAGIYHKTVDLGQFVEFKLAKKADGFTVTVVNKANHALFGQAFRQGILKAAIKRGSKTIELEPFIFERTFEGMAWDAKSASKDTLVYAKRDALFKGVLKAGDELVLTLGVQRVSKEGLKRLGVAENQEFTKFRVMKSEKLKI